MARKPTHSDPIVPPRIQWLALTGLALLVVAAIFVFGIGGANLGGDTGGNRGGHTNTVVVSNWF